MALLAFRVQADYEDAIKAREEVSRLEKELSKATFGTKQWEKLNGELAHTRRELNELVADAARSGAEMQQAFKMKDFEFVKKINDSKQSLAEERKEIVELTKRANELQEAMDAALKKRNHKREYAKLQKEYFDVNSQIDQHKFNESQIVFDISEIQSERLANAKESELYKYIMEGATEGSQDAAELIEENFSEVFSELCEDGEELGGIFDDVIKMATGVSLGNLISGGIEGGFNQLKGMYDKSISIRRDMQDIESTMKIFLGSAEKSAQFVSELEDAAYSNMFEFSELVEGSKQMLAYGHAVESIIPRMNQLSEVATATHKPLGGLLDMYNRAKSIGYVDSRMQQSFASQGIVIKDVLKEMGVAVTGTKISFQQLNDVLDYLTQEGGKFYGIMASQLNNISAEEGALDDALHSMYNEIGEIFEGSVIQSLKFKQKMVENWREIAKGVTGVIAVLGTYRAALIALKAAHATFATQQGAISMASLAVRVATGAEAKAHVINQMATDSETRAMLINQATKSNAQKAAILHAMGLSQEAAMETLLSLGVDKESESEIFNAFTQLESAGAKGVNTGATIGLVSATKALTAAMLENTVAVLANPYVLLAAALAALVGVIYMVCTAETVEEEAHELASDAIKRHTELIKEQREEEQRLADVIGDASLSEMDRYDAYVKLSKLLPQLTKDYTAFELAQMNPEERNKLIAKYQKQQEAQNAKLYEERVMESQKYGAMKYGYGMAFTEEQYQEYKAARGNGSRRTEEQQKKLDELTEIGTEQARRATELWKELNEGKEVPESLTLTLDALRILGEEEDSNIRGAREMREQEEYLKKPIEERLQLEEEALKKAERERDILRAMVDYQNRRKMTTDQLIQTAELKGIDANQWVIDPTIDEEQLRQNIINALDALDKENFPVELSMSDTQEGFLGSVEKAFNSIGFGWGADVVRNLLIGEKEGMLEEADKRVQEAKTTLNKTQTLRDSIVNPKELQLSAKKNEKLIKEVQKQVANGTLKKEDLEGLKALGKEVAENEKLIKLIGAFANGGLSESEYSNLNELLSQFLSDEQSSYKSSGGDIAEKQRQRAYELRKMEEDNQRKYNREQLNIEREQQQNMISLMAQGADKVMAQREHDHQKELDKLRQQREDKLREAEETVRAEWLKRGEDRTEADFAAQKVAILERSKLYKQLEEQAQAAYDAQIKAADIKFNNTEDIFAKYYKDLANYRKEEAEMSADLQKLYDKRDAYYEKSVTGTLSSDEIKDLEQVQKTIMAITVAQRNMLDVEKKASEEFVKAFGTTEQKMFQIEEEYTRKMADPAATKAQVLMYAQQLNAAKKKIIEEILKDSSLAYEDKKSSVDIYANAEIGRLSREIDNLRQEASMATDEGARTQAVLFADALQNQKEELELSKQQMQLQLAMDKLKADPTYFMAFRDMTQLSSKALEKLNSELVAQYQNMSNLDPKELESITNLLDKIDSAVAERDPFIAMQKHIREATIAQEELIKAKRELLELEMLLKVANTEVENAEYNLTAASTTEERLEAQLNLDEALAEQSRLTGLISNKTNQVTNGTIRLANINTKIHSDSEKIYSSVKNWGNAIKSVGDEIGGKAGEIMGAVGDMINVFTDAAKQLNEAFKKANIEKATDKTSEGLTDAGNKLGEAADKATKGMSEKMGKALQDVANVFQGFTIGMEVGKALYGVLEKTGVSGQAKYEKYAKKQAEINTLTQSVLCYQRAALIASQAEKSWFGNSSLRDLRNQWEQAQESQNAYYAKLNEQQAAYRNQSKHDGDIIGNILVGSLAGAITGASGGLVGALIGASGGLEGALIGGVIGGVAGAATSYAGQALGTGYDKQLKRAQDNLRIETKKRRKSFMGIGGRNQQTADLRTWAKEQFGEDLFDADGWINKDLANEILATYGDKLQGETQKTLEELVKLKEQYDEYQESLKEYVNSLYSPLVDNMVSAIWVWYDEGKDALTSFREAASDTFRNIINDLMKQIVLSDIIGTFQDDIKKLYDKYNAGGIDYNTLLRQVSMRTSDMVGAYEDSIPMLEEMVTTMTQTVEDLTGVDIKASSNSSSGGGFSQMSQDTATERNGRLTVLQMQGETTIGHLAALNENSLLLIAQAVEENNILNGIQQQIAESYLEIQGIHDDTSGMLKTMKEMRGVMNDWDSHVKTL